MKRIRMLRGMTLVEVLIAGAISSMLAASTLYFVITTQQIQVQELGNYRQNQKMMMLQEKLTYYLRSSTQNIYDITIGNKEDSITFYSTITQGSITVSWDKNKNELSLNDGNNTDVLSDNITYVKFEKVGVNVVHYQIVYNDTETLKSRPSNRQREIRKVMVGYVTPRLPA